MSTEFTWPISQISFDYWPSNIVKFPVNLKVWWASSYQTLGWDPWVGHKTKKMGCQQLNFYNETNKQQNESTLQPPHSRLQCVFAFTPWRASKVCICVFFAALNIVSNHRHIGWFVKHNGQSEVFQLARIHTLLEIFGSVQTPEFCKLANPLIQTLSISVYFGKC